MLQGKQADNTHCEFLEEKTQENIERNRVSQTDRQEVCTYLYLPPHIGVFVLSQNVLQQLLDQGCTSTPVHQGLCQLEVVVCRPPSLIFF